jgi:excinuclease ABC subunit C
VNQTIEQKLAELPLVPGVYFHKDAKGRVIYVGKAAKLRNRVRQYFQKSRSRDPKTEALVAEVADIDWIETETELDALFLESELIKRYKPRFNIALRDDKSQLFVRINMRDDYPHVSFTRRPLDDNATYYGPYYNGAIVRRALKYLRKIFPYSTHESPPKRACLQYHLGLCPGPEVEAISPVEYKAILNRLVLYLKGKRTQVMLEVEKDMKAAAREHNFELAAQLRNQLRNLKALRQQIVFGDKEFMDISKDQGLHGLQQLLDIPEVPRRIEGYDISHMSGVDTVASMVVFTNGIPDKTQYRKFKMRTPGNDDFAHMREVISRRFSGRHLDWPKPDLLLIDGGKGQLSSAQSVLAEKDISIPSIGLAKREEQVILRNNDDFTTIDLDQNSHVIKLLQRIRDESHRFAVSYHSSLKRTRQTVSLLDEIPTVGPATRKKLLKAFGSLKGISQARQWELEKVVGPKKATIIKQYLRAEKPS